MSGTRYCVCSFDKEFELHWAGEHALVKVGNKFYDGRGERTIKQLQKEYPKCIIKAKTEKGVWFAEDYYLFPYYKIIKKVLDKNLKKR